MHPPSLITALLIDFASAVPTEPAAKVKNQVLTIPVQIDKRQVQQEAPADFKVLLCTNIRDAKTSQDLAIHQRYS